MPRDKKRRRLIPFRLRVEKVIETCQKLLRNGCQDDPVVLSLELASSGDYKGNNT